MRYGSGCFKLLAVLLCAMVLSSCGIGSAAQENSTSEAATASGSVSAGAVTADMISYDDEDSYSQWKDKNPSDIELKGTSVEIKGTGAAAEGSSITITEAGVYVVSGKLDDGQIIVNAADEGTVRLVLNGAEIACSDNAPIYVKKAGKTVISLQEGTENILRDGGKYVYPDAETDEPDAVLFSHDDLTINGTGKLAVEANYNNGIASKDDLRIMGGNLHINSVDDGLIGKDRLLVRDGNITIEAAGDAMKTTNDTDASKGFIALEGGSFDLKAGTDGIQAETSMLIAGGKYTIVTGGGSAKAVAKTGERFQNPGGGWGEEPQEEEADEAESQSTKGIKAGSDITISGGTFSIDSCDDAIHSNNSIAIQGGDISIATGDDGIHADSSMDIKNGNITITKSYEGIESELITISGGQLHLVSSDDGINVSGSSPQSAANGRPGEAAVGSSGNGRLTINGGYIAVKAGGDGLDSNGSISMSAGKVIVNGPTNNGNGALDYDGVFEMTGGFLVASGSSGMAQAPSEESSQYSILMNYSTVQKAGTLVHLKDSKGNEVITFAPEKDYQTIAISSPELKKDGSYVLYSGGTSSASAADGLYEEGEYQSGTKLVSFTIADQVTWLTEAGVTTGGGANRGGPGGNPGFRGSPGQGGSGGPRGNPGQAGGDRPEPPKDGQEP